MVDWGGHPRVKLENEKAIAGFRASVKMAQDLGIQYNAGIGMLTEFLGMIKSCPEHEKAICRNIDGMIITVPWLWDHKVDGELGKAYWFCSNSQLYQKYLRQLTELAMTCEPDGYHIDDFGGTAASHWMGGCFCETCMPLFREYLRENVTPEKLSEIGVEKLDDFDYRKFLLAGHVKDNDEFLKKRNSLPLYKEFTEFQAKAAGEVVRQLQEYAVKLRGKPLARSVNGAVPNQQAFVVMPHIDHYSCEIGMNAPGKKFTSWSAFTYKCGDMVKRGIAGTASGQDWAYVIEHKAKNLVRCWIAESYASGHCFMAPSKHQWAYTEKKGSHWYEAKPEDYADLYQFVRKNAALFDGYEPVAKVGVLFSHSAWRKFKKDSCSAASTLLDANVPFALVGAGDELLDVRLNAADLAKYDKIVAPAEPMLDPAQKKALDDLPADKKVVWKDAASLLKEIKPRIVVEGAGNIRVLPRMVPGRADSPLVVHVLNRNYDYEKELMIAQNNLTLRIPSDLLGGRKFSKCTAFTPDGPAVTLAVETVADGIQVKLARLKLWTVLKLE